MSTKAGGPETHQAGWALLSLHSKQSLGMTMKKITSLFLAAGMVVAASAPASAVDIKVDGEYQLSFQTGQTGFTGENQEGFMHRMRLGLTMTASENLSAYAQFQLNDGNAWGNTTQHGVTGEDNDITARQLYLDWTVPGTSLQVRMGRFELGLPADAFGGNAALCAGYGSREGIVVASPVTDWLGLSAMWARTGTDTETDLDKNHTDDFYAVTADLKFEGISGSVWGAYATLDGETSIENEHNFANYEAGKAWWVGFTSTMSFFDPFTLALSAGYGKFESDVDSANDQDGWNVQAKASYTLDFGSPVLGAWYFSGDDKDDNGIMPSLGGYFTPTRTYHDAAAGLNGGVNAFLPSGNWGVQAGIEGVSFLENLSHDFLVTYIKGTNDKDVAGLADKDATYLTEDDSLVSFDLISTYEIYKNLAADLELSYIINDFASERGMSEDDWRAELTFTYAF